jgi:hypothetical protein
MHDAARLKRILELLQVVEASGGGRVSRGGLPACSGRKAPNASSCVVVVVLSLSRACCVRFALPGAELDSRQNLFFFERVRPKSSRRR